MSGRRTQSRVNLVNSSGVLRVSRDVVVERIVDDAFVALSDEPGIVGDVLTIACSVNQVRETVLVLVTASRPRLVNGAVKHELKLTRADSQRAARPLAVPRNRRAND
jgi:hypothetical protein